MNRNKKAGLMVYYQDWAYKITLFCIPFSFDLSLWQGLSIDFPVEPILVLFSIWFLRNTRNSGLKNSAFWRQPMTLMVVSYWLMTGLLIIASTLPVISLKRWIILTLHLVFAYFLAFDFMKDAKRIREYFLWLGMGTVAVMFISWMRHASWGFGAAYAPAMARPFFDDHTIFGATFAFLLALFPALMKWEKVEHKRIGLSWKNAGWILIGAGLLLGLFLTYSRGAWLSLILATIIGWGIWKQWSWRISVGIVTVLITGFFLIKGPVGKLIRDYRPQSLSGGWSEHVMSSLNFVQHVSNLERLNRWKCAWRMFKEKPLVGWGPATYSFQYGPFQKIEEMTRISTMKGDRGNAHSEYLGHLSEGGLLWGIGYLGLWVAAFWTGIRCIQHNNDAYTHLLLSAILTALTTYLVHGLVNSFLDQIEMAVWVLGAWAALSRIRQLQENEHVAKRAHLH